MLTESVRSRVTRPEPTQDGQGSSIIWPRPWQPGQVRSSVKNPCACRTRPAPPHMPQVFGLVPALAPMPEQDSQVTETGISICAVLPWKASSRRDFHVVAQVRATLAAAAGALAGHAEQVFENIGEGGSKAGAEARASAAALLEGGMTEPVIGGALVAVLENLVGLVDFLETDFAGGIARILVRMPFHRKLAKGRLEFGFVRVSFDFKGLVITALGGHPSNPPEPSIPKECGSQCRLRLNEK